jgi:hypothetical protein
MICLRLMKPRSGPVLARVESICPERVYCHGVQVGTIFNTP